MARRSNTRVVVNKESWSARADRGASYLKSARDAIDLADPGEDCGPAMSQAVLAAIAYGDALTIKFAGVKNTQEHRQLPGTLRRILGHRSEVSQISRLQRIISQKDDVQYGDRMQKMSEAVKIINSAETFIKWARELLED